MSRPPVVWGINQKAMTARTDIAFLHKHWDDYLACSILDSLSSVLLVHLGAGVVLLNPLLAEKCYGHFAFPGTFGPFLFPEAPSDPMPGTFGPFSFPEAPSDPVPGTFGPFLFPGVPSDPVPGTFRPVFVPGTALRP